MSRSLESLILVVVLAGAECASRYMVGVAGCGRRTTFVVICLDEGDGCFATGPGRFIRE